MIPVMIRTNLDLSNERWPSEMLAVPNVGDHIQSMTKHGHFQLELEVTRVTWKYKPGCEYLYGPPAYIPEINLHMTSFQRMLTPPPGIEGEKGSIIAFYHWYAPLVGRSVSSFI